MLVVKPSGLAIREMKSMYRKENKEQPGKGEHQVPDDIGVPEIPPVAPVLPSPETLLLGMCRAVSFLLCPFSEYQLP